LTERAAAPYRARSMQSAPTLRAEGPTDRAAVDALIDRAFGPGRYAKAAERLREGRASRGDLSVTAWDGEALVGAVRLWPVRIGETQALLLGPIAVETSHRGRGLAQAMAEEACLRGIAVGAGLIVLVGEARLFEPLGFFVPEPGRVVMPGPVDARRVFVRELRPGAFDGVSGAVRPEPLP
jgi:predicted N-acetyltransferase YhbS